MTTFAILPIKRFKIAKQRLSSDVERGTREALVEAMVTDVLVALRCCLLVDRTLVVTDDPSAESIARGYDAETVLDPGAPSHSTAALVGIAEATKLGAQRVLLVAGDCPTLDPKEIDGLLARNMTPPAVWVMPDRHGTGTNGLLLSPPDVMEPSFGSGSCERHLKAATAVGASVELVEVRSMALDVDTVADLEAVRKAVAESRWGAAHTRGMLNRLARG